MRKLIVPVLLWSALLAFACLKLWSVASAVPVVGLFPGHWSDSVVYDAMSRAPLFSAELWRGMRPPTVPLFYKFLSSDPYNIALFQATFSALCWGLLALMVARSLSHTWAQAAAIVAVLGFALTRYVSLWDAAIQSESLCFSFTALLLATALWTVEKYSHWRALALCIVAALWIGCRDTNAFIALSLVPFLLGAVYLKRIPRGYAVVTVAFVLMFGAAQVSANGGERWKFPLFNSIGRRVLCDPDATAYFAAHGMPVTPALLKLRGAFAGSHHLAFYRGPELQSFRAWADKSGKSTYAKWVLSQGTGALWEPWGYQRFILMPEFPEYKPTGYRQVLPEYLDALFYPTAPMLLVLPVLALCAALRRRFRPSWGIAALLLLTALPAALICFWGDSMDVQRHCLGVAIAVRLACWMLLVQAADALTLHSLPEYALKLQTFYRSWPRLSRPVSPSHAEPSAPLPPAAL